MVIINEAVKTASLFRTLRIPLIIFVLILTITSINAVKQSFAEKSVAPFVWNVLGRPLLADAMLYEDVLFLRNNTSVFNVASNNVSVVDRVSSLFSVIGRWFKVFSNLYFIFFFFYIIYFLVSRGNTSRVFHNFVVALTIFVVIQAFAGIIFFVERYEGKELPGGLEVMREVTSSVMPFRGVYSLGTFLYDFISNYHLENSTVSALPSPT